MAWLKLLRKILVDFPGSFVLGEVRAETRPAHMYNRTWARRPVLGNLKHPLIRCSESEFRYDGATLGRDQETHQVVGAHGQDGHFLQQVHAG